MRRSAVGAVCFGLALLPTVSGCGGGARVDATSDSTATASLQSVEAGLSEAEREQFRLDCQTVAGSGLARAMGIPEKADPATAPAKKGAVPRKIEAPKLPIGEAAKPLHGLSASEIAGKARMIREKQELMRRKLPRPR